MNVSLTQESDNVTEGSEHTYCVSLDKAFTEDVTVNVQVGNITTEDGDVTPVTTSVTIPAGETVASFNVEAVADGQVECNEDYKVTLVGTDNDKATISNENEVVTTINDADSATVSLSQDNVSITEGEDNTYTVSLNQVSDSDTQVTVKVSHIDTDDNDLTVGTQTITIPAGETSATFAVGTNDDNAIEGNENFQVGIEAVDSCANVGIDNDNAQVTTTIIDNDYPAINMTLSQESNSVNEGDEHNYTINLDRASNQDITVNISVGNITTEDGDVVPVTRTLTIPAGETEFGFTLNANDDDLVECNENFNVSISNATGDDIHIVDSQNEVTTTIIDDDNATVSLTQDQNTVNESDTATYTLTLDKTVPEHDTEVLVSISHISTDEVDLHATTQTVIIPAGENSITFSVTNNDDSVVEGIESYQVSIEDVNSLNCSTGSGCESKVSIDSEHSEVVTAIAANDWTGDWASDWSSDWSSDCWASDNCWGDDPITVLADGGYIVPFLATSDVNSTDGDGYGVFFQRYDVDGNKVGEPHLANTTTEGNQFEADVAALKDGGYVLSWQSSVGDSSGTGIFMQRYDADGEKIGGEIQVNSITEGDQSQVAITGLKDGCFVVSWQSENTESGSDIHLQKFDTDGEKIGEEMVVNQDLSANQVMPSIDALDNGGFVVAWQSDSSENGQETYTRVYDSDMNASEQIHINSMVDGSQTLPAVSGLSDGGFIASWINHDGSDASVNLQRFDSDGNPVGDEKVVSDLSDFTLYSNVTPEVAGLEDGGYVTVFADRDSDGSGVYYQRYDSNDNEVGDRVLLNTDEDSNQYNPHVTALHDGGFLTTWVNVSEDQSSMEVVGQKFDADGDRVDDVFKVSEITTDGRIVQDLLDTHEVNNIDTSVDLSDVDYLDFDSAAVASEHHDATTHSMDTVVNMSDEISLTDLISDSEGSEVQMNLPDMPSAPEVPQTNVEQPEINTEHTLGSTVIPELTVEVDNVDTSNLMDIHKHQITVDES